MADSNLQTAADKLVRLVCPSYDGELAPALDVVRETLSEAAAELDPGVVAALLLAKLHLLELRARELSE